MTAVSRLLAVLLAALGLGGGATHSARVPAGVRSIRISAPDAAITVADPAEVHAIVEWFDALPLWTVRRCPRMDYIEPDVHFDFRDATGAVVLQAVDQAPNACGGSIAYGNRRPLADDGFLARVSQLVGVDFDPNAQTKQNKAAAILDEAMLLRPAHVPPGSRLVAKSQTSRTWRVHLPLAQVFAYERAHRPRGRVYTDTSARRMTLFFPPVAGQVSQRSLDFELEALRGGWTKIRVTAQDTPVVADPPHEKVPNAVTQIAFQFHVITDRSKVATIVRWFEALPSGPIPIGSCTDWMSEGPTVRLDFRDTYGNVLASTSLWEHYGLESNRCAPMDYTIGGHPQAPLIGGNFLLRVKRLVS